MLNAGLELTHTGISWFWDNRQLDKRGKWVLPGAGRRRVNGGVLALGCRVWEHYKIIMMEHLRDCWNW